MIQHSQTSMVGSSSKEVDNAIPARITSMQSVAKNGQEEDSPSEDSLRVIRRKGGMDVHRAYLPHLEAKRKQKQLELSKAVSRFPDQICLKLIHRKGKCLLLTIGPSN